MARGPCTFKQSDVMRILKAAVGAGVAVRVEIAQDGKIAVVMISPIASEPEAQRPEKIIL